MKTKIFSLFILAVLVLTPSLVFADKVLFFTPTRVLLNDKDKVEVINITNLSKIARAYKISFQDLIMTPEGVTAPVDNFEYSAKRMLRFVPREFVLRPGERQTVRIMSRVKPDTADGDFHTHIRFLEDITKRDELNPTDPNQRKAIISAPMAYEALIPAVISHGSVSTTLDMSDVRLTRKQNGAYVATFNIMRQGNGQGIAYVDTDFIGTDGKAISVTPRRTIYIYRELNSRVKDIEFTLPEGVTASGTLRFTMYDSNAADARPVREITVPVS